MINRAYEAIEEDRHNAAIEKMGEGLVSGALNLDVSTSEGK